MSDLRKAAQQALEALLDHGGAYLGHEDKYYAAITALEQALAEFEHQSKSQTDTKVNLAEPEQEPVAWMPVADELPKSGVKVLACYRNRLGNLRRIRAQWVAAKTQEANTDDAEACSEYDEATDTFYTSEGWYECIDNWGDYSSVAVTEGDVTHWMPLPPEPGAAPNPRKPLTNEQHDALMKGRSTLDYGRAVEAAYGITGETE